jgi:hypothetical protein
MKYYSFWEAKPSSHNRVKLSSLPDLYNAIPQGPVHNREPATTLVLP